MDKHQNKLHQKRKQHAEVTNQLYQAQIEQSQLQAGVYDLIRSFHESASPAACNKSGRFVRIDADAVNYVRHHLPLALNHYDADMDVIVENLVQDAVERWPAFTRGIPNRLWLLFESCELSVAEWNTRLLFMWFVLGHGHLCDDLNEDEWSNLLALMEQSAEEAKTFDDRKIWLARCVSKALL